MGLVWPFGKHKGGRVEDLPLHYLRWVAGNVELRDPELAAAVKARLAGEPTPSERVEQLENEVGALKVIILKLKTHIYQLTQKLEGSNGQKDA